MIENLFTEQTVLLDVEAKDWEEAVRRGGAMFATAGNTTAQYADAMVKKLGMGLMRLKHPVAFGHEEYDPVDLLIFLCATDHSSHIAALAELMQLIEDEPFWQRVRSGMTKQEILDYIRCKDFQ